MTRRSKAAFVANIKKSGNGYYIGVPKEIIEKMKLGIGDDMDVVLSLPEVREE